MNKQEALAKFLGVKVEENLWGTYRTDEGEYMVLTEEEADNESYNNIVESLWAFNSEFIIEMCGFTSGAESLRTMQRNSCEDCNEFIKAMIEGTCGMNDFVKSAIDADGRGHFISQYDGEENKFGGYFIYHIN